MGAYPIMMASLAHILGDSFSHSPQENELLKRGVMKMHGSSTSKQCGVDDMVSEIDEGVACSGVPKRCVDVYWN